MSITNFKKIPELVVNDKLANSDVFAVANDTTTSKLTVSQLMVHVKHNAEITSNTIIDHGTTGRLVFRAPTPSAARTVLELGTIAVKNTITISEVDNLSANLAYLQSQITSNDVDITALQANVTNLNATVVIKGNNLSDIPNKYTARANLGVGYHSDVHFSNLTANGIITSEFSNSTQGGILQLNTPTSGTTLVGGKIRIDSASNRVRFYESGGSNRGFYVDLTLGANNAGTPIWHGGNLDPLPRSGGTMTGSLRVPTVLFVSAANASESPAIRLTDETGVRRGTVYWDRSANQVWLVLHDATGAVVNSIRLGTVGATIGSSLIWTDANKQIADGRVLGNVSGSTGVPVGVTLSALLDKISNTRGAVLYRGASGWTALGAGAAGQVLTSGGAGADPSWQNAVAVDPWSTQPIGVPIPVFGHIPGVSPPPTNKGYRYVNLTAGLTGAGQYNEGILTNETVSGSAPLVNATAVINLPASPMHGQTIRLIGTERRFIRAGSVGTVQDDAFQGHWHAAVIHSLRQSQLVAGAGVVTHNQGDGVNSNFSEAGARTAISDETNGTPRIANETRPRNIGATYFMRIL